MAGLVVLVTGIFCLIYGRTSVAAWRVPIACSGDALSFLAQLPPYLGVSKPAGRAGPRG